VAQVLGLPVLQPARVRSADFLAEAASLRPDALALAAYGQIIPRALLELAPLGPVNLHGSLLPAYRGAAPIQRAILAGERATGITTMLMDETLDTGDILLRCEAPIYDEDDAGSLTARLAERGADLLVETLVRLSEGACPRTPQDHSAATYAPAIRPEDAVIRWEEPADVTRNRVRALSPRPGAVAALNGRRVKIWRTEPAEGPADDPGRIVAIGRGGVEVATGAGRIRLVEVQPEGGKRMAAADWARGARVRPGDRFEEMPT
jgi:methionyl-tRNA formyltransferase